MHDNRSWCSGDRLNELLSGSQLESRGIELPDRIVAAQPSRRLVDISSLSIYLYLYLSIRCQQPPRFGRTAGASKREARLFALVRRSINFSGKACGLEGHWHRLFSALSVALSKRPAETLVRFLIKPSPVRQLRRGSKTEIGGRSRLANDRIRHLPL